MSPKVFLLSCLLFDATRDGVGFCSFAGFALEEEQVTAVSLQEHFLGSHLHTVCYLKSRLGRARTMPELGCDPALSGLSVPLNFCYVKYQAQPSSTPNNRL